MNTINKTEHLTILLPFGLRERCISLIINSGRPICSGADQVIITLNSLSERSKSLFKSRYLFK